MTTIVYDHKHKQIACDSLACSNISIRSYESKKWIETDCDVWFFAGTTAHRDYVLGKLETTDDVGIDFEVDLTGIRYNKKTNQVYMHYYHERTKMTVDKAMYSIAAGSGCDYATAALDLGYSALEAVECAAKRDLYTGGKVHVFCCETGKFVEGGD